MKKKVLLKVFLILILVILTMLLSYKYLKGLNNYVLVYVASEDIEMHELITEDMVESVEIRFEEKVKFFNNAFDSKEEIVNTIAIKDISKNTVFTSDDMILSTSNNEDALINGKVNPNYFVQTDQRIGFISLEKEHALGGAIEKGNYIDILYTSQSDDTGGLYTSLLLENIRVNKANDTPNATTSTDIYLELTHKQAMLLSIAKYNGQLDILLSDESNKNSNLIPVLPYDLYEKLIEAGYMLVDENNQVIDGGETSSEPTDLDKELAEAEQQLAQAFNALSQAKEALALEKAKASTESVEEMIKRLEISVSELESSVEDNKSILETLEQQMKTGGE